MSQPQARLDFLQLFGSDKGTAEEAYHRLRRRLIHYFARRGCWTAEDLADEVMARVFETFQNQTEIRTVSNFAYGVAFNVMQEWERAHRAETEAFSNLPDFRPEPDPDLHQCLHVCLNKLSQEKLELLMQASLYEKSRKELAESLSIDEQALTSRIFRYRRTVANCLDDCLGAQPRNKLELLALILGRRRRRA